MTKDKSTAQLVHDLDDIFSDFIRLRDAADFCGYVDCFVCRKPVFWKQSHCGHYITRSKMPVRFDDINAHAVCVDCNVFDTRHLMKYLNVMLATYGTDVLIALEHKSKSLAKFSRPELQDQIDHYRSEVKRLRKQKHL